MGKSTGRNLRLRGVFVTVVCIGVVRLIYAVLREQSIVDAFGQTLVAVLLALTLVLIFRQDDMK